MPDVADPDLTADYWTADDVAVYLGVARKTVHAYKVRGQMPGPDQQYGKTPLWRPETIAAWHATRHPRNTGGSGSTSYSP